MEIISIDTALEIMTMGIVSGVLIATIPWMIGMVVCAFKKIIL